MSVTSSQKALSSRFVRKDPGLDKIDVLRMGHLRFIKAVRRNGKGHYRIDRAQAKAQLRRRHSEQASKLGRRDRRASGGKHSRLTIGSFMPERTTRSWITGSSGGGISETCKRRQRLRPCFLHDRGPVVFHGALANTKFVRDDLAGAPSQHQGQDLLLAWCQCR